MNSEDTTKNVDLRPVTKIIASYVGHHTLAPDQLSALIISVQQALRDLGKPTPVPVPRIPAVPVRRSVQRDYVICLECGFRGKTLRRHLGISERSSAHRAGLLRTALDDGERARAWPETQPATEQNAPRQDVIRWRPPVATVSLIGQRQPQAV